MATNAYSQDPAATPSQNEASSRRPIGRYDPIGDVISAINQSEHENASSWALKATLYHGGGGMSRRDSLGCPVSPMRTVAVDPALVARRTIIFIKETVGLPLADGGVHDGYWYASDIGPAIQGERIDLFTGKSARSMRRLMPFNQKILAVSKVGDFTGCPPMDGGVGGKLAKSERKDVHAAPDSQVSTNARSSTKSPGLATEPSS